MLQTWNSYKIEKTQWRQRIILFCIILPIIFYSTNYYLSTINVNSVNTQVIIMCSAINLALYILIGIMLYNTKPIYVKEILNNITKHREGDRLWWRSKNCTSLPFMKIESLLHSNFQTIVTDSRQIVWYFNMDNSNINIQMYGFAVISIIILLIELLAIL